MWPASIQNENSILLFMLTTYMNQNSDVTAHTLLDFKQEMLEIGGLIYIRP